MKQLLVCTVCSAAIFTLAACGGQSNNQSPSQKDSSAIVTNDSTVNNSAGEPRILDTAKRGDSLPRK